jgi:two-component system chemotaxis response regulator CheY
MKILIIDDSKAMRLIVKRTLRQAGFGNYEIEEASNGVEGLQAIERGSPDLVMSDWNMPEMNGLELLTKLREQKNTVRFGFVTTEGTPAMRQLAMESGAAFLITKPFTAASFQETLGPILS